MYSYSVAYTGSMCGSSGVPAPIRRMSLWFHILKIPFARVRFVQSHWWTIYIWQYRDVSLEWRQKVRAVQFGLSNYSACDSHLYPKSWNNSKTIVPVKKKKKLFLNIFELWMQYWHLPEFSDQLYHRIWQACRERKSANVSRLYSIPIQQTRKSNSFHQNVHLVTHLVVVDVAGCHC